MFTVEDEKPFFARDSQTLNKPLISVREAMDVPGEALMATSTEFLCSKINWRGLKHRCQNWKPRLRRPVWYNKYSHGFFLLNLLQSRVYATKGRKAVNFHPSTRM